jgi:hypothetical protein
LTIDEWLSRAAREETTTLHKFNFEREKGFSSAGLQKAHQAFERFLEPIPSSDPSTANEILYKFRAECCEGPKSGASPVLPPDHRSVEPEVEFVSPPIFLKSLGLPDGYLRRLGLAPSQTARVIHDVACELRKGPPDPIAEEALQTMVAEIMRPPSATFIPSKSVMSLPSGYSVRAAPATGFGDELWWFTFEDDLNAEEVRLPDRASALQRSGYVAGLRASLGVHNSSDDLPDDAIGGALKYRILLQIGAETPTAGRGAWRQPTMFSGGFPHLFVTYPRSERGGRTVRLRDSACSHRGCNCAAEGLPEGVVPARVVLEKCRPKLRGVFLALHRDLSRFSAPTCNEIRAKRAA